MATQDNNGVNGRPDLSVPEQIQYCETFALMKK
ncbi:hypothetical protein STW0522ENT51_P10750 (plasmid) [Enterobacter kobei]|jgi:hypothetical protein|nr:hypothetical protein AE42_04648 [Enterobacter kobei]BBV73490.1 hypothetical protein STW0522ENT51_P10750 [Enterobacter kobei]VGP07286.1 hypothetical protein SB00610_00877 [Klebsiella quasipneumoniae subsp. similipneumoniae]